MIPVARVAIRAGEILIARRRSDGAIGYWKQGALQSVLDKTGRQAADFILAAVDLIAAEQPSSVLVLGYGGGVASTLLERRGIEVVSVDRDACARGLATQFFGAPPRTHVVTADAATFVRDAADGSFGAAFVDFQESATVPKSYFAVGFWIDLARVVRLDGAIVLNVTEGLWKSTDWKACTAAQLEAGLEVVAISAPLPSGNRTLISKARKPGGFSGPVGDGGGLATDCETDLSTASHPMERPSPSGPSR